MQRLQLLNNPMESLSEEIIFTILDYLDSASSKSFSATSKSFHSLESRHRKTLKLLHPDSLPAALRRYRRIRCLDFTNCPSADDGVISAAAEAYYATLRSVDLSRSRLFTHAALSLLAEKCGRLVELDLSNATELRDAAAAVAEARNLEKLWMGRCRLVSDIGIGCIAVGCKKLKLLSLKWCVRITDLGAGLLANKYTLLCALGPKSKSVSSRLKSQNDPLFWHIP
ncbi:hypothetical protein SASPL_139122 [Salvia splendens]|uniref:F-box and leucine-rich repeat protein 2/20 n=1 Tax=Salvia splendens TaxID=180675 RepID=A0A8X8WWC7_SALSN|nr:hypothetical protein SASPL_139122 [Salvia splendens]